MEISKRLDRIHIQIRELRHQIAMLKGMTHALCGLVVGIGLFGGGYTYLQANRVNDHVSLEVNDVKIQINQLRGEFEQKIKICTLRGRGQK